MSENQSSELISYDTMNLFVDVDHRKISDVVTQLTVQGVVSTEPYMTFRPF